MTYLELINGVLNIVVIFYVWYRGKMSVDAIKTCLNASHDIQASVNQQVDNLAAKIGKTPTKTGERPHREGRRP